MREAVPRMQFFDAHCDTVLRDLDGEIDFLTGQGQAHLDLPRLLAAGSCVQLFAVFAVRSHLPDIDLRAYAEGAISTICEWAERSGGRMRMALGASDIRAACEGAGLFGILGLEGGDPLDDRADNLEHFYDLGVRNLIPAWDDNAFSGTAFGAGGPLTAEGVKLIEQAQALRMMVDVSHLSDAAFEQVCQIVHGPFIASHSNCRALCPHPRNLTDPMIRDIADRGGVIGINLAAYFLDPDYYCAWDAINSPAQAAIRGATDTEEIALLKQQLQARSAEIPLPDLSWVARHVQHAIQTGGADCVGLGGDLDGVEFMPTGVDGIQSYPAMSDALLTAGLSEAQVEKVCWRNMARVFQDVLV
jgi:membrane dipeptidase